MKKKEAKSSLKVCTFNNPDFLKHLEICVNLGFSYLFENVDEYIDPIIDPVLEKNLVKKGNSRTVKIGDKDVEWDDSFRLYLTSKLSNPHYGPETFGKVMILNFSVTIAGLEDQLLNDRGVERADLASSGACGGGGRALGYAQGARGHVAVRARQLDGEHPRQHELIETLEKTKTKAVEIGESSRRRRHRGRSTSRARRTALAKRGSILFFVTASLSTLNNMYEVSLALYMVVFLQSLARAEPDRSGEPAREHHQHADVRCVQYMCRGIFETHKLMLLIPNGAADRRRRGPLDRQQLDFFLKGNLSLEKARRSRRAIGCPRAAGTTCSADRDGRAVRGSPTTCGARPTNGARGTTSRRPSRTDAAGLHEKLTPLEKMLVLRCFRVDRDLRRDHQVCHRRDGRAVRPAARARLHEACYDGSTPTVPVIFVLSPGADPASDIFKLAATVGMGGRR